MGSDIIRKTDLHRRKEKQSEKRAGACFAVNRMCNCMNELTCVQCVCVCVFVV